MRHTSDGINKNSDAFEKNRDVTTPTEFRDMTMPVT